MIANIVIFVCAIVGITGLLYLKHSENYTDILTRVSDKGDEHVLRFTKFSKNLGAQIEPKTLVTNLGFLLIHFINGTLSFLKHTLNLVHDKFQKVTDMIKGRHAVVRKGSASSVFLKDVSEYKKELSQKNQYKGE